MALVVDSGGCGGGGGGGRRRRCAAAATAAATVVVVFVIAVVLVLALVVCKHTLVVDLATDSGKRCSGPCMAAHLIETRRWVEQACAGRFVGGSPGTSDGDAGSRYGNLDGEPVPVIYFRLKQASIGCKPGQLLTMSHSISSWFPAFGQESY